MKRHSRTLNAFLYLGTRDNELKSKQYQVSYTLSGHDEPNKLIHCVIEVIPGTWNRFECPICLKYKFREEIEDNMLVEYKATDTDKDFVDKTCRKMYSKNKIKFD